MRGGYILVALGAMLLLVSAGCLTAPTRVAQDEKAAEIARLSTELGTLRAAMDTLLAKQTEAAIAGDDVEAARLAEVRAGVEAEIAKREQSRKEKRAQFSEISIEARRERSESAQTMFGMALGLVGLFTGGSGIGALIGKGSS